MLSVRVDRANISSAVSHYTWDKAVRRVLLNLCAHVIVLLPNSKSITLCKPQRWQQQVLDVAAIAEWSRSNQWLKLDVVQANEKLDKNHAMVEFKAHYHDGTSPQIHHEISHFVKHAEAWYFLDPTTEMQITMKQACICGSGKKFKQCCAQFL